jgi:hypothetical protein
MKDFLLRHRASLVVAGVFFLAWVLAAILEPAPAAPPVDPLERLVRPATGRTP